jgi:pyruvate formate lyase activating enzyme
LESQNIKPALLWQKTKGNSVKCNLCALYCNIKNKAVGICGVRINQNGELYSLSWGRANGYAIDPIEKKPLFHFKPGTKVLSFGTPGCNFSCLNCQNSHLSQWMKNYSSESLPDKILTPEMLVDAAIKTKSDGMAYTYSEPIIFFEYARDTILESRRNHAANNLFHVFVSNGYFSKELMELIIKENLISAINIDLKFMDDKKYRHTSGARLQPVLDAIKFIAQHNDTIMLELTNLVIPGENDSTDDFKKISEFVSSVSNDIPVHFSRFYPQYKMMNHEPTPIEKLIEARETAYDAGLHYVYIGNTNLKDAENTYCPNCGKLLIERNRYQIIYNVFSKTNKEDPVCLGCGSKINIVL